MSSAAAPAEVCSVPVTGAGFSSNGSGCCVLLGPFPVVPSSLYTTVPTLVVRVCRTVALGAHMTLSTVGATVGSKLCGDPAGLAQHFCRVHLLPNAF